MVQLEHIQVLTVLSDTAKSNGTTKAIIMIKMFRIAQRCLATYFSFAGIIVYALKLHFFLRMKLVEKVTPNFRSRSAHIS